MVIVYIYYIIMCFYVFCTCNSFNSLNQQKSGLSLVSHCRSRSYFTTDSQSVRLGIEYPCGTCDQILHPVGMLLSEICCLVSAGRPLWREDGSTICSVITQWSESRRTRNHILLSHLRLPQPGGPGSRIYIPQEPGGPVTLPGTEFSHCRSRSYFTSDSQSANMSWYRVPLWDLWQDIISCRNVAVWNLLSCIYWAPSLTRGWVCNLQCNHKHETAYINQTQHKPSAGVEANIKKLHTYEA
jgi:hypothetical protein